MDEVLSAALAFPTVIFTALIGFVAFFWVLVLAGGIGADSLDVDAHADVDVDVDADVDVHADVHADADGHVDGHASHGWFGSMLGFIGIGSVPVSIALSTAVFMAWFLSMGIELFVPGLGGSGALGIQILAAFIALAGGVMLGSLATYPLRGVFTVHTVKGQEALVDRICTISSSSVNGEFGEATFERPGAPLILSVRCRRPNALKKGSKAVIVSFDAVTGTYEVGDLELDRSPEPPVMKEPAAGVEIDTKKRDSLKRERS